MRMTAVVNLPESPEKCLDVLANTVGFQDFFQETEKQNWKTLNPNFAAVMKYCVSAMRKGRSCNKVRIMFYGYSGAGKSTTINTLFNDHNLCPISSNESMTQEVSEIQRILTVPDETINCNIIGSLVFVDVPGTFDCDNSKEQSNLDAVMKYRLEALDLTERRADYVKYIMDRIGYEKWQTMPSNVQTDVKNLVKDIGNKTYPNLVLLCLKSDDNRICGKNSRFDETLMQLKTLEIVDQENCNLTVLVTHASHIGKNPEKYKKRKEEITMIINTAVKCILNIDSLTCIPIVFVENEPEAYEMNIQKGFAVLPDSEISHLNLLEVMSAVFEKNEDHLGNILISSYFKGYCPEKNKDTEAEQSPLYMQFLGHAYCPVTESNKNVSVFNENTKRTEIRGNTRLIPECINIIEEQKKFCYNQRSQTKEEYEIKRINEYGLETDLKLSVNVSSEFRWKQLGEGSNINRTVTFLYSMQLFSAEMNIGVNSIKTELLTKIEHLPSTYDEVTKAKFDDFISEWGTFYVWNVGYGGSIAINCQLNSSSCCSESLQIFTANLPGLFEVLSSAKENSEYLKAMDKLSIDMTTHIMTLKITGGRPPPVKTLQNLTPAMFQDWIASLDQCPSELAHTIRLCPYYSLANGMQRTSLRQATLVYLEANRAEMKKQEEQAIIAARQKAENDIKIKEETAAREMEIKEQAAARDMQIKAEAADREIKLREQAAEIQAAQMRAQAVQIANEAAQMQAQMQAAQTRKRRKWYQF